LKKSWKLNVSALIFGGFIADRQSCEGGIWTSPAEHEFDDGFPRRNWPSPTAAVPLTS
jgi:hypothetical protein